MNILKLINLIMNSKIMGVLILLLAVITFTFFILVSLETISHKEEPSLMEELKFHGAVRYVNYNSSEDKCYWENIKEINCSEAGDYVNRKPEYTDEFEELK